MPSSLPSSASLASLLDRRRSLTSSLAASPYDPITFLDRAVVHLELGYPDLAAGDANRALLLTDEVLNEGFEYHERAVDAVGVYVGAGSDPPPALPVVLRYGTLPSDVQAHDDEKYIPHRSLATLAAVRSLQILALSLLRCGCLSSAAAFGDRGLTLAPGNAELLRTRAWIREAAAAADHHLHPASLPDSGRARREVYPWNDQEPDRFAPESLAYLNARLASVAPKCEVRVATLPVLPGVSSGDRPTCRQLGLFARKDVAPGEVALREYSLLTACNRRGEPVCDACSSDLPPLGGGSERGDEGALGPVGCPDCDEAVFCGERCLAQARERYHPVVCGLDGVADMAKDPDPREADSALYLVLLARLLSIAAHERVHPLQVDEVKYIWGDFAAVATPGGGGGGGGGGAADGPNETDEADEVDEADESGAAAPRGWTLPFSFEYNIAGPMRVLEAMGVDVFATLARHDVWVVNTLYAKFRGTASARKSARDGQPDVAAVHPLWCLANHDCNPNVQWEWGGTMVLRAREERVVAGGSDGGKKRTGGIGRGDEVLNHYCDVDMGVQDRREWTSGSLGGWCMCGRCRREAGEETGGDV